MSSVYWGPSKRAAVGGPWPRRLLHVPSMTSYEREGNNSYNGVQEPLYNAMSYTWGNFEQAHGPAIEIHGVHWKIPSVKPSHFTVQEFLSAIEAASCNRQWLWLDIACIDQENQSIKIDEIGNQAAIFERASTVYAWLTPWATKEMEHAFFVLDTSCPVPIDSQHSKILHYRFISTDNFPTPDHHSLLRTVESMTSQPFFKSVWTLQEVFLRQRFLAVLSRSSEQWRLVIQNDSQISHAEPLDLWWVFSVCRTIVALGNHFANYERICDLIRDSGMLAMVTREKFLLYSAACRRRARLSEDHIYGIMQIYRLKLGVCQDFNELQDKFWFALHAEEAVGSQLFIHEKAPPDHATWRPSLNVALPVEYTFVRSTNSDCEIKPDSQGIPKFDGTSCSFQDLIDWWKKQFVSRQLPFDISVNLDESERKSRVCLLSSWPDKPGHLQQNFHTVRLDLNDTSWLSERFQSPMSAYKVLYLGGADSNLENGHFEELQVGLIVRQFSGSGSRWRRVGICSWPGRTYGNPRSWRAGRPSMQKRVYQSNSIYGSAYDVEVEEPEGMWVKVEYRLT